jgi:hypothetical protein
MAFLAQFIRQPWVRATFGSLDCSRRKSTIRFLIHSCYFKGCRMTWPWKTCSRCSSIGWNDLNMSVGRKGNTTEIHIPRLQMCMKLRFGSNCGPPISDTAKNSILLKMWLIKQNIFNCDSIWIRITISKNSKCLHKIYHMRPDVRFFS